MSSYRMKTKAYAPLSKPKNRKGRRADLCLCNRATNSILRLFSGLLRLFGKPECAMRYNNAKLRSRNSKKHTRKS